MSGQPENDKPFQDAQMESVRQFDRGALQALLQPSQCNRFYIQALPDRVSIVFGAVGPVADTSNSPIACATISSSSLLNRQMAIDLTFVLTQALRITEQELGESRKRLMPATTR
jgi:hypothetical protein